MNNSEHINKLVQQEKYQEALQLLRNQPGAGTNAATKALIAQCLYRMGNFEDSANELTEAISLAPEQAQLYSDRGVSYFMMGKRENSLQDFNKAQQLETANPYRYSSRAYVKDAFGDTKGAIEDYQKAIEIDPEDAISYNNLGLLLEKVGYQKEAQKHFAKADQLEGRKMQSSLEAPADAKPKMVETKPPKQTQPLSARYIGNTIRSIFTTRKGFQEFMQFWLGKR